MPANDWDLFQFKGTKWLNVNDPDKRSYLINSYRVLLTRARQGMVIWVPEGDLEDHTRYSFFYDPIAEYLENCGLEILD